MRCMVADCQQTAGSNPLRAAGKAAGVQLGWWRAGTVLLCLARTCPWKCWQVDNLNTKTNQVAALTAIIAANAVEVSVSALWSVVAE